MSIGPFCGARDLAVHLDPGQRVVAKNLPPRFCDGRVIKRPDIENNHTGPRSWLLGDRRAAFGTEVPEDRIAAAADTAEGFECALDSQRLLGQSNQRGKGATSELLAIPAMAHRCTRWVGLGCVAHRAAEATAFDLHLDPLHSYPFARSVAHTSCLPHGQGQLWSAVRSRGGRPSLS